LAVEIELFGGLLPNLPRRQTLILEQAIPVRQVITQLGLNSDVVGLVVINGVQKELDDLVPTTCRLCFFPPVSGGAIEITFKEE
jgi:molybdopterin converting factor small subunit